MQHLLLEMAIDIAEYDGRPWEFCRRTSSSVKDDRNFEPVPFEHVSLFWDRQKVHCPIEASNLVDPQQCNTEIILISMEMEVFGAKVSRCSQYLVKLYKETNLAVDLKCRPADSAS